MKINFMKVKLVWAFLLQNITNKTLTQLKAQ